MEANTIEGIKKLSRALFSFEQEYMLDHGSTMPVQYIVKDHGIVAIPAPFRDYDEKIKMSQFTTFLAGLLDADAIIFLSEAWFSVQEAPPDLKEDDSDSEKFEKARRSSIAPSKDPNRKEKLMLLVFFGNGETMLGHSEIFRAGSDNRPYTNDFEWFSEEPTKDYTTRLFKAWKGGGVEQIIGRIKSTLPEEIKSTLDSLQQSMKSGKSVKDQILESSEIFGRA